MPTFRTLSAPALLAIWEQGLVQQPGRRALTLLHAAVPEASADTLAQLSIGQRNALLLGLRERAFGSQLVSVATCPACNQRLELSFAVADIGAAETLAAPEIEPPEAISFAAEGYAVRLRLPNSLDLLAIADQDDVATARQELLDRCLLSVHQDGEAVTVDQLPASVVDRINDQLEQADPLADTRIALTCPTCEHQWHAVFDIAQYFWREISDWAVRTLRDVHVLASAYGWHEANILNMHPWRRQIYLEMVSG